MSNIKPSAKSATGSAFRITLNTGILWLLASFTLICSTPPLEVRISFKFFPFSIIYLGMGEKCVITIFASTIASSNPSAIGAASEPWFSRFCWFSAKCVLS